MIKYEKLAKISSPFAFFTTGKKIWKADDHFLISHQRSPFLEEYRRFYIKDIQYIAITRTMAGYVLYSIISLLLLLCLAMCAVFVFSGFNSEDRLAGLIIFGVLSAVLAAILLYSLLFLGATSRTVIKTLSGEEKEAFRGFYRRTMKVVGIMKLHILLAQGAAAAQPPTAPQAPTPAPQENTTP